jgi:hypothetical protein
MFIFAKLPNIKNVQYENFQLALANNLGILTGKILIKSHYIINIEDISKAYKNIWKFLYWECRQLIS